MDLREDLRKMVVQRLRELRVEFDPEMSLEDLLIVDATVGERRVRPVPRKIFKTSAFTKAAASLPPSEREAAQAIEAKFASGADVNGHLSKWSLDPSKDDGLLVDWGVHHLHLSLRENAGDRFLGRTNNLAFAHVAKAEVYLIDILPHGNFETRSIIELLLGEFPEFAAAHEVKGIIGLSRPEATAEPDIRTLRRGYVNSPVTFRDRVYFPPGSGFMGSGDSFNAVRRSDIVLDQIDRLTEHMNVNGVAIREKIVELFPHLTAESLEFSLAGDEARWLLYEKRSGRVYDVKS